MKICLEKNTKAKQYLRRSLKFFAFGLAGYLIAYSYRDIVRYIKIARM